MSFRMFRRLVRAERLLLATLDDHVMSFVALAVLRSLAGKRTVALFLRFHPTIVEKRLVSRVKRVLFGILRHVNGIAIVTILPFSIDQRHRLIATDGLCDPQLWDMHDGRSLKCPERNAFSHEVETAAHGRKIVVLPGSLTRIKGFGLMAEMLAGTPGLAGKFLFVAAGKVGVDCCETAEEFKAAGGLLIDRRISDQDLEGLYAASDFVWCFYTADYDQASGIFGRAIQFGKTPIVRSGSMIERFACDFGAHSIMADPEDLNDLAARLLDSPDADAAPAGDHPNGFCREAQIGASRSTFINVISARLDGRPVKAEAARKEGAPCQHGAREPREDPSGLGVTNLANPSL